MAKTVDRRFRQWLGRLPETATARKTIVNDQLLNAFVTDRLSQLQPHVDKSLGGELIWFDAFTTAAFYLGLTSRWKNLAAIAGWFDRITIYPEFTGGRLEPDYMRVFVWIGCTLNPSPPIDADELEKSLLSSRSKRAKSLAGLWKSILGSDQKAFSKLLPTCLDQFFDKNFQGQIYRWIAVDISALAMIAVSRGMTLPTLKEKQSTVLVTADAIGFNG